MSTEHGHREPPRHVSYSLDEALRLLADLEDVRDALIAAGGLAVVVGIENQIRRLSHRLDFDEPEDEADG